MKGQRHSDNKKGFVNSEATGKYSSDFVWDGERSREEGERGERRVYLALCWALNWRRKDFVAAGLPLLELQQ